jgi:DMSO/TMAO reductase YedYZ molybdopterin-dependent catalytic subunit
MRFGHVKRTPALVAILVVIFSIGLSFGASALDDLEMEWKGAFAFAPLRIDEPAGTPERAAQEIEINEYQGERLGSVNDFRENSIKGVQDVDIDTYSLQIDGLVDRPSALTYAELQEIPHIEKLVTINCVEGWSVTALWEGIPLATLLDLVAPQSEANTIIFHASDGYTTSLPLDFVLGRNLIIADRINGIALPASNGFPFQLVAEDKWGYKWIRWITRIELSDDPEYRGYWESRGYSNQGDADGPMFGD